jgi:serine/threonine protein kinase
MVGTQISRYKIVEKLGEGGMGVVYKALDTRLQRTVAIKMLPAEFAVDEKRKKRLMREAQAASALNHPNICTIHDIDEWDGSMFVVMEYLQGKTLSEEMKTSPLSIERALKIAGEIGEALDRVHQLKIIHRDIKPSNIMITDDGNIKILDFGLASIEQAMPQEGGSLLATIEQSIPEGGQIAGTIRYMSPEQIRAEDVDVRTDVFSFGVVLYEMLAGRSPFHGSTLLDFASAVLKEDPESLRGINPAVPPAIERIIKRALGKNREARYQSIRELLQDLNQASEQKETSVAVMYFENLSSAKEDEYFRDGMTEDIITELWKINDLKVFPRSAVIGYRDKQVQAVHIGRDLNATHILEGSVRRAGVRIRISAQLVETATGHAIWASRMDREMKDIFEVQDEIASSIAQALRITLSPQEEKAIALKPTVNTEAYDYYLRGRSFALRRTRPDLEIALEMYEHAIALDPNFAEAFAGIAHACGLFYYWHGGDPQLVERGMAACDRALALKPNLPEALAARAMIYVGLRKYDEAIRDAQMAVAAKPDVRGGYWALGSAFFASDRIQECVALADVAVEHSGDDDNVFIPLILSLERAGRPNDALILRNKHIRMMHRQLELTPDDVRSRILLANSYAKLGKQEDAITHLEKALALRPKDAVILYNAACTYALLGRKLQTLELLKQVKKQRLPNLDWMARDPDLDFLHGDPEFERLFKREE